MDLVAVHAFDDPNIGQLECYDYMTPWECLGSH